MSISFSCTVFQNKVCLECSDFATLQAATGLICTFCYQIISHVEILYYIVKNHNINLILEAIENFSNIIRSLKNNLPPVNQQHEISLKKPRFSKEIANLAAKEVYDFIVFQAKE